MADSQPDYPSVKVQKDLQQTGIGPVVENQVASSRTSPALDPVAEAPSRWLLKGGDPAAGSPTATLLRLHPNHRPDRCRLPPEGWVTGFGSSQLSWCDGRCVQGPGTYSPRHADPRLLAIPTSWSRVADSNPN